MNRFLLLNLLFSQLSFKAGLPAPISVAKNWELRCATLLIAWSGPTTPMACPF